jgi:hypothetical protein
MRGLAWPSPDFASRLQRNGLLPFRQSLSLHPGYIAAVARMELLRNAGGLAWVVHGFRFEASAEWLVAIPLKPLAPSGLHKSHGSATSSGVSIR